MKWPWKVTRGSTIIILASVAGLCLIAKVWTIRHILHQRVEVNDLLFPLLMMVFYEAAEGWAKKKELPPASLLTHPFIWIIAILVATALSMIPYLR